MSADAGLVERLPSGREIWEVANQLGGWIDPTTPEHLANFLSRESEAASELAETIVALATRIRELEAALAAEKVARAKAEAIARAFAGGLKDNPPIAAAIRAGAPR